MIPLSQQKLKLKIDSKHFLVLYLHGYCQRRAAGVHFSLFINLFQSQHHQKSDGRTAETMPALRATADAVTAACNALEPVFMHTHAKSRTSELKIMAGFFQLNLFFTVWKRTMVLKLVWKLRSSTSIAIQSVHLIREHSSSP